MLFDEGSDSRTSDRTESCPCDKNKCAFRPALMAVAGLASGLPAKHPVRKGEIPDHDGHDDRSADTDKGKRRWGRGGLPNCRRVRHGIRPQADAEAENASRNSAIANRNGSQSRGPEMARQAPQATLAVRIGTGDK